MVLTARTDRDEFRSRSRNFFNVERMVVHTVRNVKDWGDPADILSSSSCVFDAHAPSAPEHCTPDGEGAGKPVGTMSRYGIVFANNQDTIPAAVWRFAGSDA